jgi:hypothetical protein
VEAAVGMVAALVVVPTASAAGMEAALTEVTISIVVISGDSVLSVATTTTQGAGGAHAITGKSVTDDCWLRPQGRSQL